MSGRTEQIINDRAEAMRLVAEREAIGRVGMTTRQAEIGKRPEIGKRH